MSLIRPVIRMCAVAALRDRTWAESRVFDSNNTPLIDALKEETKPYITVYTDDDTRTNISGLDVYLTERRIALTIELGVASAVVVENKGTALKIPQTDQAMEALIDFMEGQVIAALIGDPMSAWGEILRGLINKVDRMPSIRGGSADRGTRWAARQLTLIVDTISDPAPGVVLPDGHPIRQFIALARTPAQSAVGMAEAANLIEVVMNETPASGWRQAQALLGLTNRGIYATGIVPLPEGDELATELKTSTPSWDEALNPIPAEPPDPVGAEE